MCLDSCQVCIESYRWFLAVVAHHQINMESHPLRCSIRLASNTATLCWSTHLDKTNEPRLRFKRLLTPLRATKLPKPREEQLCCINFAVL